MKKVAILQSNYIPWKGYFDIINSVDEFILYDDMQYTKRDWRNRNKIKTPNGTIWLTIPVDCKGKFYQKINETMVLDNKWCDSHWKSISFNYAKSVYFNEYSEEIKQIYIECKNEVKLSLINYKFIVKICELLDIKTKITWASDYNLVDGKTERLVALCKEARADMYLSGPAAKDYIEEKFFKDAGILLAYKNYNYPQYRQLYGEFNHYVSILDLLFNEGKKNAKAFMNMEER